MVTGLALWCGIFFGFMWLFFAGWRTALRVQRRFRAERDKEVKEADHWRKAYYASAERVAALEANAAAEADALSRANARAEGVETARKAAVDELHRVRHQLARQTDAVGVAVEALRAHVESRRAA